MSRLAVRLALLTLASILCHHTAQATTFKFINIADTTGQFDIVSLPSINNGGAVAFYAQKDGSEGVFKGSVSTSENSAAAVAQAGGASPSGGNFTDFRLDFAPPAINNNGSVAFHAVSQGGRGIYRHDPVVGTTLIGDTNSGFSISFSEFNPPTVNDSGVVSFSFPATTSSTILKGSDESSLQTVIDTSDQFDALSFPNINNAETIAFPGKLDTGEEVVARKRAGQPVEILGDNANSIGGFNFQSFGQVGINNGDVVVVKANLDSGEKGIFVFDGSSVTAVAIDSTGDFHNNPAINDAGQVAYSTVGAGGIFLDSESVLAPGDTLSFSNSSLSGKVASLGVDDGSLNSRGWVAFKYVLEDGTEGVAVAVPEPGTATMLGAALVLLGMRRKSRSRRA